MTDSDAKEWVTVKVPKEVRDDASDDPRTYGDIMRDGLGETAPREDTARAVVEELRDEFDLSGDVDVPEAISDDVREQLDRIESAASTAEERTGTLERKVDNLKP